MSLEGVARSSVFEDVVFEGNVATRGGAPGVGRAVNASVVASAAGVFIADYFSPFVLD